jgi:hypothetical protein
MGDPAYLWIVVHNDGPGAEFEARVDNFVGYGEGGSPTHAAWEHEEREVEDISRGHAQRVKFGSWGRNLSVDGQPYRRWPTHSVLLPSTTRNHARVTFPSTSVTSFFEPLP